MNRITVAMFPSPAKAEPIRDRLTRAGIPAEIHDELRLEKLWFVSKPGCGTRIEVPAAQFERAYNLLTEWDTAEGALAGAIRCPECGSLRVDYPQFTRKSFLPNLVLGSMAAIGLVEKDYYCQDCHFTWPKEGSKASASRPNSAPYYFIEGVPQKAGK